MSVRRGRNRTKALDSNPYLHTRKVEVWHASDEGDLQEHFILLPRAWRCQVKQVVPGRFFPCMSCSLCYKVDHALRVAIDQKVDALLKEGYVADRRTIKCGGPYRSPEDPESDQYVIGMLARREKPQYMSLDEAEQYSSVQPGSDTMIDILRNAQRDTEGQARANEDAAKQVPSVQREQEEVRQFRRRHGLPEFKEQADGLSGSDV